MNPRSGIGTSRCDRLRLYLHKANHGRDRECTLAAMRIAYACTPDGHLHPPCTTPLRAALSAIYFRQLQSISLGQDKKIRVL